MSRRQTTSSQFNLPISQNVAMNRRENYRGAISSHAQKNGSTYSLLRFFFACVCVIAAFSYSIPLLFENPPHDNIQKSQIWHNDLTAKQQLKRSNELSTITNRDNSKPNQATLAMINHPSPWVDGEKHLKKHLLKLKERQENGVDVGVKHLTLWKGKDVPVWTPKDGKELHFDDDDNEPKFEKNNSFTSSIPSLPSPLDIFNKMSATHDTKKINILLEPTFGKHRSNVDAVFALAEGYNIDTYLLFIDSLRKTGFDGDIVLSVSAVENMGDGVEKFLKSQENLVVYTMNWDCYDRKKGVSTSTAQEGVNLCKAHSLYQGCKDCENNSEMLPLKDPREARPVATIRYELYWIWSTHYLDSSLIMLIDSRDTYFQLNPFPLTERSKNISTTGGLLHLFAENKDVLNIGKSVYNSRWMKTAYGDESKNYMSNPVICSGSTVGEKLALEIYLRAMVAEFDETKCTLKGCDQGFHNYLYYSKKLEQIKEINEIKVHEQGMGVINNLAALRDKSLREQNILDTENNVLNWDKSLSPVVHQFDRDDELRIVVNTKKKELHKQNQMNK